jgi:hypothetical protein
MMAIGVLRSAASCRSRRTTYLLSCAGQCAVPISDRLIRVFSKLDTAEVALSHSSVNVANGQTASYFSGLYNSCTDGQEWERLRKVKWAEVRDWQAHHPEDEMLRRIRKSSKKPAVDRGNSPSLKSPSILSGQTEYETESQAIESPSRRRKEDLFPANDTYGLRVLYASQNPAVDIIFVHGLTGDSYNTWLDAKSGVYWPVDLLSKDIPDVRILTFGYDADVTKPLGPVGQNDLRDHAVCLVHEVAACRNEDNVGDTELEQTRSFP